MGSPEVKLQLNGKEFQEVFGLKNVKSDGEEFALVKEAAGETFKLCPLEGPGSVRKAAEWVYEHRGKLPFEWRRELAQNILKKAEELKMSEDEYPYLQKAAGMGCAPPENLSNNLLLRACMVGDANWQEPLEKLAFNIQERPYEANLQTEYVELIADIDEECGLNKKYAGGLPTPEEIVYEKTLSDLKQAESELTRLANGSALTERQLENTDMRKAAALIGGDFEEEISKNIVLTIEDLKEAVQLLGEDDADTLEIMAPEDPAVEEWEFLKGAIMDPEEAGTDGQGS